MQQTQEPDQTEKFRLLGLLAKTQKQQNYIAEEIYNLIKSKQKELYRLTQIEMDTTNKLFDYVGDDIPNLNSKIWNEIYDMSDGHILGWNVEQSEFDKVLNS
jgi:hypothetical protein